MTDMAFEGWGMLSFMWFMGGFKATETCNRSCTEQSREEYRNTDVLFAC